MKEALQQKRASIILGLENEMEAQDVVIEVLRELMKNEEFIDSKLTGHLDEGPKRIRPPTREELYIDIKK